MQYAKMPLAVFRDSRLSKNDLRVLAVLIYRSDKKGECYPSLTDISKQSGLPYSRISKHTKRLKSFGLIDKKPRENGSNNMLIYTVLNHDFAGEASTQSDEAIYTQSVETIYTQSVETTPINKEEPITINKESVVSAKRFSGFSSEDILSVKIPEILAEEKGFILAWENWVKTKVKQKKKNDRFESLEEVELILVDLEKWLLDGRDIVDGLETAGKRKWKGFRKHYFVMMENTRKPRLTKIEEIDKAFADLRKGTNENNTGRNAGSDENTFGDLSKYAGDGIHRQSVDTGTKRLFG
jgi:DNA-binding MarR family transcriptional regulator